MDWKAEAVEKLRGYEANKRHLEGAPAEQGERPAPICADSADPEALELGQARLWVAMVDSALEVLDPDGRLVLEALDIYRAKGNAARLQEVLSISSPTTIYKRREKALQLFTMALYGVDIAKGPPR